MLRARCCRRCARRSELKPDCCRIEQISGNRLEIPQGSLYPALYRLEHEGWLASEWGQSDKNRKAKYYRLTAAGRRRLNAEAKRWNHMADAIGAILSAAPEQI
jgi:PadR family transcriptional regulator